MPQINELPELVETLPSELKHTFDQIFQVSLVQGRIVPPATMRSWIEKYFGAPDIADLQAILKIRNRLTLEATLFNPLRRKRPVGPAASADLDTLIDTTLAAGDIFRDPLNDTPADLFGRIEGKHCISASNVAKYDAWHGLVIFHEAHPLRFSREQLQDYFSTAYRWLKAAHAYDTTARYPMITWNSLWKSGASLVHGHLQTALSHDGPYVEVERWQRAAQELQSRDGSTYLTALGEIYRALDLCFYQQDGIEGYASLTPFKDRELLLWGDFGSVEEFPSALADATFTALRRLIERERVRSFNLAIYIPPFGASEQWLLPWCVRIVDRGDPRSRMSDIGAMEMFGSPVVSSDPFAVAAALRD
jgi:hypothetical protein